MVQSALADLFGISMSLGTVNSLRQEASDAVAYPVEETHRYVQQQPVVGADETSFAQGNVDRCNPKLRQVAAVSPGFSKSREVRSELWVAVTPLVTFFQIALSRCSEAALRLLGEDFGGILTSDRHGAYNWVDLERRQLCWAHLKREFIKISERPGVSGQLGAALVKQQEKLFELWHRVRDGTLARHDFQVLVLEIRFSIKALLQEAADHEIGSKEKTPLAKTVRTCRQLLKVESLRFLPAF
jgi:hypothetical protein